MKTQQLLDVCESGIGGGAAAAVGSGRKDHLDLLESEAIFIMREVAAECRNPFILFSGGKDSAVLLHLACKAFDPEPVGFPLLHIDTGHNYPEVLQYRDQMARRYDGRLLVRSVQDSIRRGSVRLRRPDDSRNRHQSVTLLEAIAELEIDACLGGRAPRRGKVAGKGAGFQRTG